MRIHPLRLLRFAIFLLLILPALKIGDLKPLAPSVVPDVEEKCITKSVTFPEPTRRINELAPSPEVIPFQRFADLQSHLDQGRPISIQIGSESPRKAWLRPFVPVSEDFQITLGSQKSHSVKVAHPKAWRGFVENFDTRISITLVGQEIAAHISEPDGTTHSIYSDPETDKLLAETKLPEHSQYTCQIDPRTRIARALSTTDLADSTPILQSASIEARTPPPTSMTEPWTSPQEANSMKTR